MWTAVRIAVGRCVVSASIACAVGAVCLTAQDSEGPVESDTNPLGAIRAGTGFIANPLTDQCGFPLLELSYQARFSRTLTSVVTIGWSHWTVGDYVFQTPVGPLFYAGASIQLPIASAPFGSQIRVGPGVCILLYRYRGIPVVEWPEDVESRTFVGFAATSEVELSVPVAGDHVKFLAVVREASI